MALATLIRNDNSRAIILWFVSCTILGTVVLFVGGIVLDVSQRLSWQKAFVIALTSNSIGFILRSAVHIELFPLPIIAVGDVSVFLYAVTPYWRKAGGLAFVHSLIGLLIYMYLELVFVSCGIEHL